MIIIVLAIPAIAFLIAFGQRLRRESAGREPDRGHEPAGGPPNATDDRGSETGQTLTDWTAWDEYQLNRLLRESSP